MNRFFLSLLLELLSKYLYTWIFRGKLRQTHVFKCFLHTFWFDINHSTVSCIWEGIPCYGMRCLPSYPAVFFRGEYYFAAIPTVGLSSGDWGVTKKGRGRCCGCGCGCGAACPLWFMLPIRHFACGCTLYCSVFLAPLICYPYAA